MVVLSVALLSPASARAGGFAVPEVGARRTAMAAVVGRPDELSAVYHNPAGLTLLPGTHLYLAAGFAFPQSALQLRPWPGSNRYIHEQVDTQGNYPRVNPSQSFGVIPMIAASTNILYDQLWAALSFYVPNAVGAAFPAGSSVRFHLVQSYIVAGYGGLSLAWKPLPWLSVGAGVSAIYVQLAASRKLFPILNGTNVAFVLGGDSDLILTGSDLTVGWNAGLLLRPVSRLSIGATVIGRSDATLKGDVIIHGGDDSKLDADITGKQSTALLIPWTFMAGANLDLTPTVEIGAEVRYWLYSQLKQQHTDISGITLIKALDSPKGYHDSWQVSGGVRVHSITGGLKGLEGMAGLHYDSSPAPDQTVSLDQPSFNHVGLHSGIRYSFADTHRLEWRLGLTWAHYWYLERRVGDSLTMPPSNFVASGDNDIITATLEVALSPSLVLRKRP